MNDYMEIIENNKDQLFESIKKLVSIKSVAGEACGNSPFGKGVQEALDFTLEMAEKDGFIVKNVDNYGGHIDFPGETDDIIAMVGHLDVVPEGDVANWTSNPFDAEIRDGRMYGRGVLDDKGPLMIGYYAMKALKESGFKPKKTIRIILGCDEETNWDGMQYYMEREKVPVAGFSPDADFPVIFAEKGLLQYSLTKAISNNHSSGICLKSMQGGTVANAVADSAVSVIESDDVESLKTTLETAAKNRDYKIDISTEEKTLTLTAKGVSSHAAFPHLGLNAISIMFNLLGEINFANDDVNKLVSYYNEYIAFALHGEKIGCYMRDEPSGELTFNVGKVLISSKDVSFTIDSRFPVTKTADEFYMLLEKNVNKFGFKITKLDYLAPLYKEKDDPVIKVLMDTYKQYTGDKDAEPIAIGGATYARAVPNTVAFGPVMPGIDDMCHQPNEFMRIDDIMTSAKIFADVLYKLAK